MHAEADDPTSDLRIEGPQPIGRFDLKTQRHLEPIEVGETGSRSGVWDVLPHPNGLIYFTTFYETAGAVDPASGESRRFPLLGRGLNELALADGGNIAASRYGGYGGDALASGSLVVFTPTGELVLEAALAAPPGLALAPKTVAWDANARRYWIVTDLVWRDRSQPAPLSMHPALVLDEAGREIARIDAVELHFVRFAPGDAGGRGVAVTLAGGELRLVELDALSAAERLGELSAGSGTLLDSNFAVGLDFVQDVAFAPGGDVIVTRWSGLVQVVGSGHNAHISRVQLPRQDGLYYAAARAGDGRICATHCRDRATASDLATIDVVCAPLEPPHGGDENLGAAVTRP